MENLHPKCPQKDAGQSVRHIFEQDFQIHEPPLNAVDIRGDLLALRIILRRGNIHLLQFRELFRFIAVRKDEAHLEQRRELLNQRLRMPGDRIPQRIRIAI